MNQDTLIGHRYRLGEQIGKGGMGTVFKGVDTHTGAPVAIKSLTLREDREMRPTLERFTREARILHQLNHPNIVKMLDTVSEADHHYIVMELVGGGSLENELQKDRRLSTTRVLQIALELADALTRAHHLNIIHRDIKPANVLLADDGTPRLTDFGVSQIGGTSSLTKTGMVVGTLVYLSPESLQGKDVDARADIWAFGILLFEMLVGYVPFEGSSMASVVSAILNMRPPDLEALRPDLPVALIDLIYRMLEKNRDQRIPSVRLVGAELEGIIRGYSTAEARIHTRLDVAPPLRSPFATDELHGVTTPDTPLPAVPLSTLPVQPTPFIGREDELEKLAALLHDPAVRLVTITGPGGMGKSRLGLEAAAGAQQHFADGVFFVSLAALKSPDLMLSALAEALSLRFEEGSDARQQLLSHLQRHQKLLVMDNFEHVLDGVGLVVEILQAAPNVKILATSRERLNVRGEVVFPILGMEFPTLEETLDPSFVDLPSVQLFVQSAHRADLSFELTAVRRFAVARICYHVKGMPLAIELAAAWVEMLEVDEIADEIEKSIDFLETDYRDIPERHRSVRAVFDYSWQTLNEAERDTFARLAVFRGGFTRDAAQEITGATLRGLNTLVNKSLLYRNPEGRYTVHELLREYAEEKITREGLDKTDLQERHCAYYARFLREHEPNIKGFSQTKAALAIEQEIENVRAAWAWAVEHARPQPLDDMLETLNRFYDMRTYFQEGEKTFREGAEMLLGLPDVENTPARRRTLGRLLARQSWFARRIKTPAESRRLSEESLVHLHHSNAQSETAFPITTLGCLHRDAQEFPAAVDHFRAAVELYRAAADRWGVGFALYGLADALHKGAQNDEALTEAARCFEEGRQVCAEIEDLNGVGWAYNGLGNVARRMGKYPEARAFFEKSLEVARQMGFRAGVLTDTLRNLGWLAWRYFANGQEALDRYSAARAIAQATGAVTDIAADTINLGHAYALLKKFDEAHRHFFEGLRLAQTLKTPQATAIMLSGIIGIGGLHSGTATDRHAVEGLGLALAHPELNPALVDVAQLYLIGWQSTLPPADYQSRLERGKSTPLASYLRTLLEAAHA